MIVEIKKCGDCGIETNKGKYWGTGKYLCEKCHNEWTDKKKRETPDSSVTESTIKKLKKRRDKKKRNLKIVKTKLHEEGFQNRLTQYIKED